MTRPSRNDFILAGLLTALLIFLAKTGAFESKPVAGGRAVFEPHLYKVNEGIITAKYIDSTNHNNETIEILMNDTFECYYLLNRDVQKELFEYIAVNDSLIKTDFGDEVTITRDGFSTVFKLND